MSDNETSVGGSASPPPPIDTHKDTEIIACSSSSSPEVTNNNDLDNGDGNNEESQEHSVIAPVDPSVVRKICSAQVVVTLSLAVKELVENALDAGATSIEIRTTDYGRKTISVSDNGKGIPQDQLQYLGLGHHTSKLTSFSDLSSVSTFGFRGEALPALASLAPPLRIQTSTHRQNNTPSSLATYAPDGTLLSLTPSPPLPTSGTVVTLSNLFSPLPVRHKEFTTNAKRELHKVISTVTSYALINYSVRFSLSNDNSHSLLNVEASKDMRTRISQLFGHKLNVTPFDQEECVSQDILDEFLLTRKNFVNDTFTVDGFVDVSGGGTSGVRKINHTDSHFVYVNKRPVDAPKVTRVVLDSFRSHVHSSKSTAPFFALNVTTRRENVDVNVSKDKRSTFIRDQKSLLVIIKASLLAMLQVSSANLNLSQAATVRHLYQHSRKDNEEEEPKTKVPKISSSREPPTRIKPPPAAAFNPSGGGRAAFLQSFARTSKPSNSSSSSSSRPHPPKPSQSKLSRLSKRSYSSSSEEETLTLTPSSHSSHLSPPHNDSPPPVTIYDDEDDPVLFPPRPPNLPSVRLRLDWQSILYPIPKQPPSPSTTPSSASPHLLLSLVHLPQSDFTSMRVVGQFNLGFIVGSLASDLFIIDQHAADEKANFEHLTATTIFQTQRLIAPQPIQLSHTAEDTLLNNLPAFHLNGFNFDIHNERPPGSRVSLTQVPFSKNTVFNKHDVEELVFMMEDHHFEDNRLLRPSRVRDLLASRACRKSVMVGNPLSLSDMNKILNNLARLKQPWNCPHGRPTIRHLARLPPTTTPPLLLLSSPHFSNKVN